MATYGRFAGDLVVRPLGQARHPGVGSRPPPFGLRPRHPSDRGHRPLRCPRALSLLNSMPSANMATLSSNPLPSDCEEGECFPTMSGEEGRRLLSMSGEELIEFPSSAGRYSHQSSFSRQTERRKLVLSPSSSSDSGALCLRYRGDAG